MAPNLLVFAQASGSQLGQFVLIIPFFAVMYFLLIRPQQKQAKEHQALVSGLKKGDKVVTQGGIIGKIFAVGEREVTVEIAAGVKVQVLKGSVQSKVAPVDEAAPVKAEEKEEK